MEYRFLGRTGLKVSALGYGTWVTFGDQIGQEQAEACLKAAYEAGINLFDTAESYARGRAETMLGTALRKFGWKRSDLVVSTKLFWGGDGPNDTGLSRKHILEGVDASLRRLGLEAVDLLFCHRPDRHTPIEETVRALSHVIDQGKAHYWGTSEWSALEIRTAWDIARLERLIPPSMEQPQYNMFTRERVEREYAPLYREIGLGTTVWSPLASGFLSGKYLEGVPQGSRFALRGYGWLKKRFTGPGASAKIAKVRRLVRLARELDLTLPRLALAWCLRNPHVSSVLTGASRPEQVAENATALEAVPRLTPEALEKIEAILDNAPAPETDHRTA